MRVLVIDIGGTFIKYALMTEKSEMLCKGKIPTPLEGRAELVEAIGKLYDSLSPVDGIAISMPGIIDVEKGYCSMGGAIAYNTDFYFRDALYERCPVKITMDNDAKCAAMAEATVGALKDISDGVVLLFGTMIGGGIIKDHRLIRGTHFSAGEVSYIISERASAPTYDTVWGNRCGVPYLCKLFAEKKGLHREEVDGIRVFEAVNSGDKEASLALAEYTKEIAVQIFNLQTILDPDTFAIGGGISAQPVFIEYINRHLENMYAGSPYNVPKAKVVTCRFGNDANLIGALQGFLGNSQGTLIF